MYFREVRGTSKPCFFKQGRNERETRDYVNRKVVENVSTLISGYTGSGKSVFANTLANDIAEQGNYTVIYITEKESDELANAFHMFPAKENYHVNMLKEQQQNIKTKPVKIYHPFTFKIPYKRKLAPINYFTFDIKKISRSGFNSLISSDSPLIVDVCLDVSKKINDNATFYDFMWKLFEDIKLEEEGVSYDPDDMFIPIESAGSKTTIKNVKLALKPFRENYMITESNCKHHLDYVKMCNDSEHVHHITTKFISSRKLKIFTIIETLMSIDRAIKSGKVKKQLVLVFEEIKILFGGNLEPFQLQLLDVIYKLFSRIRTKAFVIATTQSLSDLNYKVTGLFSKKFLGRLSDNDVKSLIKYFYLRTIDQQKLRMLKIGEFVLWESGDYEDEQLSEKIMIDIPPFANAEQGEDFFTEYKKAFPDKVVSAVNIYKEMKRKRDKAEKRRTSELKEFEKKLKGKKEVKDLKKDGKLDEAKEKIQELKDETVEILMKQVYDLKEANPDWSWSKIVRKTKGIKHHDTAQKYYHRYKSILEQKKSLPKLNRKSPPMF